MHKDKSYCLRIDFYDVKKLGVEFTDFIVFKYLLKTGMDIDYSVSQKKLELYSGLTEGQVEHALKNLIEMQIIKKVGRFKFERIYKLNEEGQRNSSFCEVNEETDAFYKYLDRYVLYFPEKRNELKLSVNEYIVLYLAYSFSTKAKSFRLDQTYISKLFDKSTKQVGRYIARLKKKRLVVKNSKVTFEIDQDVRDFFKKNINSNYI